MADYVDPVTAKTAELSQELGLSSGEPATPRDQYQALVNKSGDKFTTDFDPMDPKPGKFFSLFGQVLDRATIEQMDRGKDFLKLQDHARRGRRGFFEAVTDVQSTDLAILPGMENLDFGIDALPLKVVRQMPDILKRIQDGNPVSDQERLYARLYQADSERRMQQGSGGIIGDFVRSMPAFGTRMYLEGKAAQFAIELAIPAAGEAAMAASVAKDIVEVGEMTFRARKARQAYEAFKAAGGIGERAERARVQVEALEAAAAKGAGKYGDAAGMLSKKEESEKVLSAFYAARTKAATEGTTSFSRAIARANNEMLREATGLAGADVSKLSWWSTTRRGFGEVAIGAPYLGSMYAVQETAGTAIANSIQGNDLLDGRRAAEKRARAASIGDDRLGKYAELLALGDTFSSYMTLKSGEGLGHIFEGTVGRAGRSLLGAVTPQTFKNYAAMLEHRYGDASRTRATLAGFEAEAVERGAASGREIARAKNVSAAGWWLMNHMAKHDVDAKTAWGVLHQMGYSGWKNMMLLTQEGKALGGLYGSEGGPGGFRQAYDAIRGQTGDEMFGEAVAFALPAMGVLGLSRLGASVSGGSRVNEHVTNIRDYVAQGERGSGVHVVGDEKGNLAITRTRPPLADGTQPLAEAPASREKAIDSLYELALAEVRPMGEQKVFQRVAQHMIKISQFLITADPSALWRPSQMLFNAGIHEEMTRNAAKIIDDTIREHRIQRAAEAGDSPKPADMTAIERAELMKDPAIRTALGTYLDAVQQMNGSVSMKRGVLDGLAAKHGVDAKELAKELAEAETRGDIYRVNLGGGYSYFARAIDGVPAAQIEAENMRKAYSEALDKLGLSQDRFITDDYAGDKDVTHGSMRLDLSQDATPDEIEEFGIRTGVVYRTPEQRIASRDAINRVKAILRQRRFSTDAGRFAAIRDGDGFRMHPLTPDAEDLLSRPEHAALRNQRFQNEGDVERQLGAMGLNPEPVNTPAYIIPHRNNLSESFSRLAFEHQGTTKFGKAQFDEYLRVKEALSKLAENSPERPPLEKRLDEIEKIAEKSLEGTQGKDVFIKGKRYHATAVGGVNYKDGRVVMVANLRKGSVGHMIEELIESARRLVGKYDIVNGEPLYSTTEADFFGRLSTEALRLSMLPENRGADGKHTRVGAQLAKVAEMFKVGEGERFNLDLFSKALMMLDGWHSHSSRSGGDLQYSAAFNALRESIYGTKSSGEAGKLSLLDSASAFYEYAHRDILGHLDPFEKPRWEWMPPEYETGWETAGNKERLRPRDLLNRLSPLAKNARDVYAKIEADQKPEPPEPPDTPKPKPTKPEPATESDPSKAPDVVTAEMLGLKPEEVDAAYEARPEEARDQTREEFMRVRYCHGGHDQKATPAPAE